MKLFGSRIGSIALFATALLALSANANIMELNDDNFEHVTQASTGQTTGKWFVQFYATWCGHCKRLAPIWQELDQALAERDEEQGILLAKLDAVANRATAERFDVKSFPTLIYFANGHMYKYEGPRTVDALAAFVGSGYQKDGTALDVPPPPGFVEVQRRKLTQFIESNDQLSMLVEDFEHIVDMRKNAAVVLVLMGAIVGLLLGCMCASGGGKTSVKKKKKKTD